MVEEVALEKVFLPSSSAFSLLTVTPPLLHVNLSPPHDVAIALTKHNIIIFSVLNEELISDLALGWSWRRGALV
jgi:flavin reductase (DIM6/NTAB) family NADH-FMN oxidoreductase RutF